MLVNKSTLILQSVYEALSEAIKASLDVNSVDKFKHYLSVLEKLYLHSSGKRDRQQQANDRRIVAETLSFFFKLFAQCEEWRGKKKQVDFVCFKALIQSIQTICENLGGGDDLSTEENQLHEIVNKAFDYVIDLAPSTDGGVDTERFHCDIVQVSSLFGVYSLRLIIIHIILIQYFVLQID